MRPFLFACATAVLMAGAAAYLLDAKIQETATAAHTTTGARL
jgi:hypothetical protein